MKIHSSSNIITLRINEEITDKEYKKINNVIDDQISKLGKIRFFLVVDHYPSLNSAESLYYDLRFIKVHADQIEKIAVVCDKTWKKTWIALFGLFAGIRIEYFDSPEFKNASNWVSGDS
jgi:hypothetical protein